MRKKIAILSATVFILACSKIQAHDFEGSWQLTEIAGKPVAIAKSTLTFDSKTQAFSARVGCNNLFGRYSANKGTITLSKPATTLMGCPDNIAALESALSKILPSAATYRIDQNRLHIYDRKGTLIFNAKR